VTHEVEKRIRLVVFLPHEQHRHVRRQQVQRGGKLPRLERDQRRQPVADGAVADLIVVLDADDEAIGRNAIRRRTVTPAPVGAVPAVVHESIPQRLRDRHHASEVGIVARSLAGEARVNGVMQVVAPLGVEREAGRLRSEYARIIEVALADHDDFPLEPGALDVHRIRQLPQHMAGAEVVDPVDRIEPEPVDVVLGDPMERVVDHEAPNLVAVRAVVVDRRTPGSLVRVREVRPITAEIVPFRTDVVVDDVEDHRQVALVRGIHQAPKLLRPAVGAVWSVERHAVVSPVAVPGKLGDRHDLDRRDAERAHPRQMIDRAGERTLGRESTDVQLVDDQIGHRPAPPPLIRPAEYRRVDDARRSMNPLRLVPAHRIGNRIVTVEAEAVVDPGAGAVHLALEHAMRLRIERMLTGAVEDDVDRRRQWRPDSEPRPRPRDGCAALERPRLRHADATPDSVRRAIPRSGIQTQSGRLCSSYRSS
jgi:hypothetical protein